jgi:hypothetical protein
LDLVHSGAWFFFSFSHVPALIYDVDVLPADCSNCAAWQNIILSESHVWRVGVGCGNGIVARHCNLQDIKLLRTAKFRDGFVLDLIIERPLREVDLIGFEVRPGARHLALPSQLAVSFPIPHFDARTLRRVQRDKLSGIQLVGDGGGRAKSLLNVGPDSIDVQFLHCFAARAE